MKSKRTEGEKIRIVGIILFILTVLRIVLILMSGVGLVIDRLSIALIVISVILYMAPYYNTRDYQIYDFGYFTTKIHKTFHFTTIEFPAKWDYCEVVEIRFSGRDKTRTMSEQQQYGNMIRKWKVTINSWDYFKATCFRFDDEKKRTMHENKIKSELKKNKTKNGSIKFHSSENVLIAFECYSRSSPEKYGFSAYPFLWGRVASKAAKNVKMKSEKEMDEYEVELEKVKKEKKLEKIINTLKNEEKSVNEFIIKKAILLASKNNNIPMDFAKLKKSILDESDLMDVVKESSDDYIRKVAIKRIDNQSFLKDVALNDTNQNVVLEAVERIEDESALVEIAKNANDRCVRNKAKDKIKDVDLISEIEAYEKEHYMICEKCGGRYSIVSSHYNESWEWSFYDLKCHECGHTRDMPQHILDEWPNDIDDEMPMTKTTTVFGKTFPIPQGYEEVERYTAFNLERVTFKNNKSNVFKIKVDSDTNFPFDSPYIELKIDKTVNGIPGKELLYEDGARFVYIDKKGLLVLIDTEFDPYDEIYGIVVC